MTTVVPAPDDSMLSSSTSVRMSGMPRPRSKFKPLGVGDRRVLGQRLRVEPGAPVDDLDGEVVVVLEATDDDAASSLDAARVRLDGVGAGLGDGDRRSSTRSSVEDRGATTPATATTRRARATNSGRAGISSSMTLAVHADR